MKKIYLLFTFALVFLSVHNIFGQCAGQFYFNLSITKAACLNNYPPGSQASGQVKVNIYSSNGQRGPYTVYWTNIGGGSGSTSTSFSYTGVQYMNVPGASSPYQQNLTVRVTDKYGCWHEEKIHVTHLTLVANIQTSPQTICQGQSITLQGTETNHPGASGFDYQWSSGYPSYNSGSGKNWTVSPSETTTYKFKVVGGGPSGAACYSKEKTVKITVVPKPTISISSNPNTTTPCEGSSMTLYASGGSSYSWSGGGTYGSGSSKTITVPSSTTTITVSSGSGSCSSSKSITIYPKKKPNAASISPSSSSVCSGGSVSLSASASNATSYSWSGLGASGGGSSKNIYPNNSGYVYVTPSNDCGSGSQGSAYITVNPTPNAVYVSPSSTSICQGQSVTLSASGGTGSYSWSGAGTSGNGGSKTVYQSGTVTVTSSNSCGSKSATAYISVKQNVPAVSLTANGQSGSISICSGQSVTLSASGGTGSYSWSGPGVSGSGSSKSVNQSGTYSISSSGGNYCGSQSASITVTFKQAPTVNVTANGSSSITICPNQTVNLVASGATSYSWNQGLGSGASKTVTPSNTTTYTVTGTTNGCQGTPKSITVNVNSSQLNVQLQANPSNTICNGESVNLIASGADSYTWNNGLSAGASHTVSPTSTTTYTVTGEDANGCKGTKNATITVNNKPTVNIPQGNSTICQGASIELTATGASTYTWSGGGETKVGSTVTMKPTATGATIYTVEGVDANGCKNTSQVTITVNPSTLQVEISADKTGICEGESVELTRTGNASTYVWSGGGLSSNQSTKTVSPTTTTTYRLTGTSADGICEIYDEVTITVTPIPSTWSFGIMPNGPICSGEAVTLNAIGTGLDFTYTSGVSGAGGNKTDYPTNTTSAPIDINYTVYATKDGCNSDPKTHTMTVRPRPTVNDIDATKLAICSGETVKLTGSGTATNYTWSGGGLSGSELVKNVSPTQNTTYKLVGVNTYGCKDSSEVTINVTPLPTVDIIVSLEEICPNEEITLTASGADSYTWTAGITGTGNQRTDKPSTPGTVIYKVKGTKNGCESSEATKTVIVRPEPDFTVSSDNKNICNGESTEIKIIGLANYTYTTTEGTITGTGIQRKMNVSPTSTTVYTIEATNTYGCKAQEPITITVTPKPIITLQAEEESVCLGETIELNVSGDVDSYTWTAGITGSGDYRTDTPTSTGTYTYKVKGTKNSCVSDEKSVTVKVNPSPEFTLSADPQEYCADPSKTVALTIEGQVGYTYVITGGPLQGPLAGSSKKRIQLLKPTQTTVYYVEGTNLQGCKVIEPITITVNDIPDTDFSGDNMVCVGETIELTPNEFGGTWTSLSPSRASIDQSGELTGVSTANSGSSTVTVKYEITKNGCTNFSTKQIQVKAKPQLSVPTPSITHVKCYGESTGSAKVNVTKGKTPYTYDWGTSSSSTTNTANDLSQGEHTVIVTDDNGCASEVKININQPNNKLTAEIKTTDVTQIKCYNGKATAKITASGGTAPYKYSWDNGATYSTNDTNNDLTDGTYNVKVKDDNDCQATTQVTINNAPNQLSVNISSYTDVICLGTNDGTATAIVTGGIQPYTYLWDDANAQSTETAVNLTAGTYVLTVQDANNCKATKNVVITETVPPTLNVSTPISCDNNFYTVNATSNGTITTSNGKVENGKVTEIPLGTNPVITATIGQCSVSAIIIGLTTCPDPSNCTLPNLQTSKGVCDDPNDATYSVAFSVSPAQTVIVSAGTLNGNIVKNIPINTNITITAGSGDCQVSVTRTSPKNCTDPCTNGTLISVNTPVCQNGTYDINFASVSGVTVEITPNVGTVGTNSITGIPRHK